MLIARGVWKARCTSDFVIASNVTRLARPGSTPSTCVRCHAMASPSRSRSVANQTSLAPLASFRSSVTVFTLSRSIS